MTPEAATERAALQWTLHLGASEPRKVVLVIAIALGAGLVGMLVMRSPLFAVLGILMVLAPNSEFLLPVRYAVTEKGVSSKWGVNNNFLAWEDVRQVRWSEFGVKLSPLNRPSRLEAFRGVYLRFRGNKQDVEEAVKYWYRNHETLG
jgi:hypothetical protein